MKLRLDKDLERFLAQIRALLPEEKVYLVGGAVRDILLHKTIRDLDFVLARGSIKLAKAVKKHFQGVWYTLDDEHQTARVILNQGEPNEKVLDFTSFVGESLDADLRQRNFSINAMAIDLDDPNLLIDPLNGRQDLAGRILRLTNPKSLLSDPLRVIRGIRMIRFYNLSESIEILDSMRVAVLELGKISGERVRDELLKCLDLPDLPATFTLLARFGIYQFLQREISPAAALMHSADFHTFHEGVLDWGDPSENKPLWFVQKATLLENLEKLLINIQQGKNDASLPPTEISNAFLDGLRKSMDESLQAKHTREQLLILAAFFYLCGFEADFADNLTRLLMLGQKENKALEKTAAAYHKIASISDKAEVSNLDLYRLFREADRFALEGALLHLAEEKQSRTRRSAIAIRILETWFNAHEQVVDPPRLIDGTQLQEELAIGPGPALGFFLEQIREAQVTGEVQNRTDALNLVKKLLYNKDFGNPGS